MSFREYFHPLLSGRRLDVGMAVLGLLIAVLLFPLRIVVSQFYIVTLPIVLGAACVLYLLAASSWFEPTHPITGQRARDFPRLSSGVARLVPSVVVALTGTMVLVAAFAEVRSLLFYNLVGVTAAVVLVQVLLTPDEEFHVGVLLAEIVLVGAIVRFAGLYTVPGFIGIDVWSHVAAMTDAVYSARSLGAIAGNKYYSAPFYHLLTTVSALFYDQSLRNGLYLSVAVVMVLAPLFVYAIAAVLSPRRWAVLAAGLFAFADHVVRWSLHLIPTSLGLFFFLAVFYFLVRVLQTNSRRRDFGLLLFFSIAVVLTHQISTFITLVLLGAAIAAAALFKFGLVPPPNPRHYFDDHLIWSLVGLVVTVVAVTLAVWAVTPYRGSTFLLTMLGVLQETVVEQAGFLNLAGPTGEAPAQPEATPVVEQTFLDKFVKYVDNGGFLLLLFGGAIGSLSVFHRKRSNQATYALVGAVLMMLFFVLGLPLFGIRTFIPGRWIAFLYVPLVLLTVIGFGYLRNHLPPRAVAVVLVLFAVATPNVMTVSTESTLDNPVFPSQHVRYGYTESELAAVQTIGDLGGPARTDTPIYTDHPYASVFTRTDNHFAQVQPLENGRPMMNETVDTVVYRTYQSTGGSFFVTEFGSGVIRTYPRSQVCPARANHVYANGNVRMCVLPGEAGPE